MLVQAITIKAVLGLFLPLLSTDHQLLVSLANDNNIPVINGGLADLLGGLRCPVRHLVLSWESQGHGRVPPRGDTVTW